MALTPMQEIKQRLIELGVPPQSLRGCSNQQIDRLMQAQGVSHLPKVYVEFLRELGCATMIFLDEYAYRAIETVKLKALGELDNERDEGREHQPLPDDAFVFYCNQQRYAFNFFRTQDATQDADSPFFQYMAGQKEFVYHESFAQYIQLFVDRLEVTFKENPHLRFVGSPPLKW